MVSSSSLDMRVNYTQLRLFLMMMTSFYLGCIFTFLFISVDSKSSTGRKTAIIINNEGNMPVWLVLIILSSPNNADRRNSIRKTWLTLKYTAKKNEKLIHQSSNIKHFFVLGLKGLHKSLVNDIITESEKYKDILILDEFTDDYKYLSKKVILSFKWIFDNIKEARYILKCDDDSFIRLDLLLPELYRIENNQINSKYIEPQHDMQSSSMYADNIYWGYFYGNAKVYKSGRWKEPSWFLCDRYLPYALGGGYVLSMNIVKHIVSNIAILREYKSEDVSVGVWTASFDINRIHDFRFDTQWTSRGCDNSYLIRHKQSISDMYEIFSNLISSNYTKMCSVEKLQRMPYIYNWGVLPSQCCVP